MNQAELISKVASISGETRKAVEAVLKTTADVIAATELEEGGEVALPGLGKLQVKNRAARTGRTRRPAKPSRSRPSVCRTSPPPRP